MNESIIPSLSLQCGELSLVLPAQCVVEVVPSPVIKPREDRTVPAMVGYLQWNKNDIPLLDFARLCIDEEQPEHAAPSAVVLQPIPDAAHKSVAALLVTGRIAQLDLADTLEDVDLPERIDRRYCSGAFAHEGATFIIPNLKSLAVVFSYF